MSGPKSIGYEVARLAAVQAEALAQLRVEAGQLRARAARLDLELSAAREGGVSGLPNGVETTVPDLDDPQELEAAVGKFRIAVKHAEGQLGAAVLQHRIAAGLAALAVGATGRAQKAQDALLDVIPDVVVPGDGTQERAAGVASRIERLLKHLPIDAPPAVRDEVARAAELAATEGTPQLLDQLGILVDRAALATAEAFRARRLLDAALGLTGTQIEAAGEVLRLVESGVHMISAAEWRQWDDVVRSARKARDRSYVAEAATDILVELGYEVGPAFSTALSGGTAGVVTRAGWDGYGVRLRSGEDSLNVNVVRDVDDGSHDADVEREWCDDVRELRQAFTGAGIRTQVRRAEPAGSDPVQRIMNVPRSAAVANAGQSRRRRRGIALERPQP